MTASKRNITRTVRNISFEVTRLWYKLKLSTKKLIVANWWVKGENGGSMSKRTIDKKIVVAHYFMDKSRKAGRNDLSNKKLQKLVFYAQAWNLVLNDGNKLIDDKFEAWIHGAAIPALYGRYKDYGWKNITEEFDEKEFDSLSDPEKKLLDEVWEVYGKYDADYLEVLNHSEDPWQQARQNAPPFASSRAEISTTMMKQYYGERLKKAKS